MLDGYWQCFHFDAKQFSEVVELGNERLRFRLERGFDWWI